MTVYRVRPVPPRGYYVRVVPLKTGGYGFVLVAYLR